jgi:hypothetical protein
MSLKAYKKPMYELIQYVNDILSVLSRTYLLNVLSLVIEILNY